MGTQPPFHWAAYTNDQVIDGDQVGQAGPAFDEPMLAGTNPLVVFHMPGENTQNDLAQHPGQADRPVVPRIFLPALLVDGCYTGNPPVIWDLPW